MAEISKSPLGKADDLGNVIEIPDDRGNEHGPDIGGKSNPQGRKSPARPGTHPHGDEQNDDDLGRDYRSLLVRASGFL